MSEETEKTPDQKNSRWALPHVFVLLFGIIVFATIMTWILPAGDFNRVTNSAAKRLSRPVPITLSKPIRSVFLKCSSVFTLA